MALLIALALGIAAARGQDESEAAGLAADLDALPALIDQVARDLTAPAMALATELARADLMLLAGAGPTSPPPPSAPPS